MNLSDATPTRPKIPEDATSGPEEVAQATIQATPVVFQTPRRKSPDGAQNRCSSRCSASSSRRSSTSTSTSSNSSARKATTSERMSLGVDDGSEGLRTPALRGGSCAICLSPLKNKSANGREVYTVQLCRHNFHRDCLVESRRVGNTGCPYCRGELERGLTPEASAEEREAKALAERQEQQREAIRNAAGRARMALARSLRLHQQELARGAAVAAS